jgi:uncharacterized protein
MRQGCGSFRVRPRPAGTRQAAALPGPAGAGHRPAALAPEEPHSCGNVPAGAGTHIVPFANSQQDGAMAVFTTREAAEEFVRGWTVKEWNEALVPG